MANFSRGETKTLKSEFVWAISKYEPVDPTKAGRRNALRLQTKYSSTTATAVVLQFLPFCASCARSCTKIPVYGVLWYVWNDRCSPSSIPALSLGQSAVVVRGGMVRQPGCMVRQRDCRARRDRGHLGTTLP